MPRHFAPPIIPRTVRAQPPWLLAAVISGAHPVDDRPGFQQPAMAAAESLKGEEHVDARLCHRTGQIALIWLATLSPFTPTLATVTEARVNILFVGNSSTHERYEPVRTYNAGF
jgi:hypothetical protein